MEEKKTDKVVWCVVIVLVILLGIGGGYYLHVLKQKSTDNNNVNDKVDEKDYLKINDSIKVLRSDLKVTENAKVNSSKEDKTNGLIFADVIEPDFQFETHYLFVFAKDGKLVFETRDFKDKDNDNNRYKIFP